MFSFFYFPQVIYRDRNKYDDRKLITALTNLALLLFAYALYDTHITVSGYIMNIFIIHHNRGSIRATFILVYMLVVYNF